jgi:ubiquinone/menaquinone biosynthesis C-methylase UbiE
MSQPNLWTSNLGAEIDFWRRWFVEPKHAEGRRARIAGTKVFAQFYVDLIGAPPGTLMRVLDVGSGPISTLGCNAKNNPVVLVCTDALADHYNALLDEFGYLELPRIVRVKGEELLDQFGLAAFEVVHCANALDHFEDPALSFENMYRVCRPGGAVVVISVENEGERERYQGLHQWNLNANDEGLFLSTRVGSTNLLDRVPGYQRYAWHYLPSSSDFRVFRAILIRGAL